MSSMHALREAHFAAALLDPEQPCPPGLRAWNGADPARRFAVHRNNVLSSLAGALAASFPVVQALVGPDFFRAMAVLFARRHPPRSPVLHWYGARLPAFIDGFGPARELPWLGDVARLEWARVEACHAAEAGPLPMSAVALARACGERVGALRLVLHPALRVLESAHPVVSIWAAHQGQGALDEVLPGRAECALVLRPGSEVLVLPCDAGTAAFARALRQGSTLGPATAQALCRDPSFNPAAALALLLAHEALCSIELAQEDPA